MVYHICNFIGPEESQNDKYCKFYRCPKKKGEKCMFFGGIRNKITELEYIQKMVVLRSSPNDMKQLLNFYNFYLKPNLRNNSVKTVNFEILKSRDIEILSLGVKKNVK